MTAALVLTAAGRAAVADNANVGMNAIQLRQLAIGSGLRPDGTDDDARTTLRNSRDVHDVAGSDATPGHIAFRADFMPSGSYSVTEAGLFARIGDAGQQFLFAYWAVEDAADAVAAAASGTTLVMAGVIAIQSSEADLTLTPSLDVAVGSVSPPDASLTVKGLVELATVVEHAMDNSEALAATPTGVRALIAAVVGTASDAGNTLGELETRIAANDGDIAGLLQMLNALAARVATVEDRPVGNETLIYESAAGAAITNQDAGTALALTADFTDFDAFYVLYSDMVTPGRVVLSSTVLAAVNAVPSNTNLQFELTDNADDDSRIFIDVHTTGVRNLTLRASDDANETVFGVVGVEYARP